MAMKEKMTAFWNKVYKDVIAVCCIILATTFLIMHFLDVEHMDLSIPMQYEGGDDMSAYVAARFIQDSGWNFGTDKLSAPDSYYDNKTEIIAGLHNGDVAFTKLFLCLTGDVAKSVNLMYLSAFYMIAVVSYIVLRALKIREWISAEAALVYAFLPFIFIRNIGHVVLACYYFVPLSILMSIWLCEDERFMRPDKDFFKYKRNYGGLVMTFLMASEGIGYWQIFSCFMMFTAVFTGFLRRNADWKLVKRGITAIASLVVFVIANCIPEIVTILSGSGSGTEGRWRGMVDAEMYCLKIVQLVMPVNGHGIGFIQDFIDEYNDVMPLVNENKTSYIGIIAVFGFFFLLVWLFVGKKEEGALRKRLTLLSDLNIVTLMVSVIGGLGSIVYLSGITLVRSYNRISVYIAFIGITAFCLIAENFSCKIKNALKKIPYIVMVSLVMMFAIWEQNPGTMPDYETNKANWENDEQFISDVEAVMDENDAVFQLPYVEYPENGGSYDMPSLSHYIGYIHSDKLRWSFGITVGTENDAWYETTAELPTAQMIQAVLDKGFDGIYINRNGYKQSDWERLESEIQSITGSEPIVSRDLTLSFFKLR